MIIIIISSNTTAYTGLDYRKKEREKYFNLIWLNMFPNLAADWKNFFFQHPKRKV